jgi:hypothetical protein
MEKKKVIRPLDWSDTTSQRPDESISNYINRARFNIEKHLEKSHNLLYGEECNILVIGKPVVDAFKDLISSVEGGGNISAQQLNDTGGSIITVFRNCASVNVLWFRRNLQTFLVTQAVLQGFTRPAVNMYSMVLIHESGDAVYKDGKALPVILDKVIHFERIVTNGLHHIKPTTDVSPGNRKVCPYCDKVGHTDQVCCIRSFNWSDTTRQRSNETMADYIARATSDIEKYLYEFPYIVNGEEFDIAKTVAIAFRTLLDIVDDISVQQLKDAQDFIITILCNRAFGDASWYRRNFQTFLVTQAVVQGFTRPETCKYSTDLVKEWGDAAYKDGDVVKLILDKVIQFERAINARNHGNQKVCTFCKEVGHSEPECFTKREKVCTFCHKMGHTQPECYEKKRYKRCTFCEKLGHSESGCYTKKKVCTFCHKVGHSETECFTKGALKSNHKLPNPIVQQMPSISDDEESTSPNPER